MLILSLLCRRSQFPQLQQRQLLPRQFSSYCGRLRFIDAAQLGSGKNSPLPLAVKQNITGVLTFPLRSIYVAPSCLSHIRNTNYPSSCYFNMSSKHLGPGSTCPPLQDGKIRIYSMRFCPYAHRAVLVAIAKNVPHDVVNVNLKTKPEWLFQLNPLGKVPTLQLNSKEVLYESLILADYLDEAYPGRQLQASDPKQKAFDRLLVENFGKVQVHFYKLVYAGANEEEVKAHIEGIRVSLAPFEKELEKRGTTYFGGNDAPGMPDYMIWPWIERLPVVKLYHPALSDYESAKKENPRLENWRQVMKEDPAVKAFYLTPEQHKRFIDTHVGGGVPDYDCLDE